jgi:hypothetical protein
MWSVTVAGSSPRWRSDEPDRLDQVLGPQDLQLLESARADRRQNTTIVPSLTPHASEKSVIDM